ncbi:MAG: hypothetical protein Kow0037_28580 [Calditrichia bacterium]
MKSYKLIFAILVIIIMLLYFFGHKVKLQHIKKDIIEGSIDDFTPEEIYQRI